MDPSPQTQGEDEYPFWQCFVKQHWQPKRMHRSKAKAVREAARIADLTGKKCYLMAMIGHVEPGTGPPAG